MPEEQAGWGMLTAQHWMQTATATNWSVFRCLRLPGKNKELQKCNSERSALDGGISLKTFGFISTH